MASDDEDVPEAGAIFTFGKSRFADNIANKFWIRDDPVRHVSCGDEHSAVVTENGKLYTFGSNDWGQLGHGNTRSYTKPSLVKKLKPEKVRLVSCGRNHTIVSTASGKLYSFGCGGDGQLGHGDSEGSLVPKAIESLAEQQFKMISCGAEHSAVLTVSGALYTWGSGGEGQTGLGMGECETPTHLHVAGRVTAVSCGYYHMAVMTENGSLFTCGEKDAGKLGLDDSQLDDTSQLQKINSIKDKVTAVACGGNHTAAVTDKGHLYMFGNGENGQLGLGSMTMETSDPTRVTTLGNVKVKDVSCGESFTAAITKHGHLYTCGDGRHGKLGMGDENFSNIFKLEKVSRFANFEVAKVSCGGCHMLVIAARKDSTLNEFDSDEEAEKDILSASMSSTKGSLFDAVDGMPSSPKDMAATVPIVGSARDKRRLRNLDSLGGSLGGSLPPINKSALPPLSSLGANTLPAFSREPVKGDIGVNRLDMTMLPKISAFKEDNKKATIKSRKKKERQNEEEENESSEDEGIGAEKRKTEEARGQRRLPQPPKKESVKQKTEESSSGEEEEESEEEESEEESESPKRSMKVVNEAAVKTTATVALKKSPQLRKRLQKEEEESGEESGSEEESESEEEDDEETSSAGKTKSKVSNLTSNAKVLEAGVQAKTSVKPKKEDEESEEESEGESEDEEETEDKKEVNRKEKTDKGGSKSDVKVNGKKTEEKKMKETKKETDEEEETDDEDDDDEEEESDEKNDDDAKKSKGDKVKEKEKKSGDDSKEGDESPVKQEVEQKRDDKKETEKEKEKGKKGKKKKKEKKEDDGKDERESDKNEEKDNAKDQAETAKETKPEDTDRPGTPSKSAKTKDKKSGICTVL